MMTRSMRFTSYSGSFNYCVTISARFDKVSSRESGGTTSSGGPFEDFSASTGVGRSLQQSVG